MSTTTSANPTTNPHLRAWVEQVAGRTRPDRIEWCDGSEAERVRLTKLAVEQGILLPLNAEKRPGCYLHRSDPNDVARVEHLTFICSREKEDAGPNNNWLAPAEAYAKLGALFDGCMQGRTMYVIPYVMGPIGSPMSKIGIEITDSVYVVLKMRIMTRMGRAALEMLADSNDFNRGLHSTLDLDPEKRFICHFPEDNTIWSTGSGYGGNVLLGKKCLALRIGSYLGRREGWLAEHMLILGVESPAGETTYVAAAFPSACGKTNFAMMIPPESFPGWKVETLGDDIAWMRIGEDGRLWAVNPEYGFFGVAPGTNEHTNPNAMATINKGNSVFTNVALTEDGDIWWEGLENPPAKATSWKGEPWTPDSDELSSHPNSRYCTPIKQCDILAPEYDDPRGVPIDAILFGGRRKTTVPLVFEARDWTHGTFLGATLSSETTAAAVGQVGVVRRDPMAMLPFIGYHAGDYFNHWITMGKENDASKLPRIFYVNWFRRDEDGGFLWPGFGENSRVLKWVVERIDGQAAAVETPIGHVPAPGSLDVDGLDLSEEALAAALAVDPDEWKAEIPQITEWFEKFGDQLPTVLWTELDGLKARLGV